MRFKLAALPLVLLAAAANAEEYNSITKAKYTNTDRGEYFGDLDQFNLDTIYYFDGKEALGPLKEFEYINKVSNLSAGVYHFDIGSFDDDIFSVGGEYFADNGLVLGAHLRDVGGNNVDTLSIGYLFTPDFLITVNHVDNASGNDFSVNARYNHQLNATDYIGFTLNVDEGLNNRTLSSKYFTHLGGEQYLTAELTYVSRDVGDEYPGLNDDFWELGTEYFFTQRTSIGFTFDENDQYSLGMNHFFNRNFAVEAAYTSYTDSDFDSDIYQVGLTVQF
ncbi:putative porin [uncultured Microbulbifer sp.]|uniref:putative porin n=1 Tax=uncultured Microbulbifer sp. TaxID=348147 RepID=UPI00262C802A|nr:putative porin [uncultured Microbulbifer sp.]